MLKRTYVSVILLYLTSEIVTHNYVASRAGRYLGILVIPRYLNQTIDVLSKFQ